VRLGVFLALAAVLAGCRSEYIGMSRQLGMQGQALSDQAPVIERQRNYFDGDPNRPRNEEMIKVLPDGSVLKHGAERQWYRNGQLSFERQYDDGEPVGRWVAWYENGELRSESFFGSQKLQPMTWWHESGQVSTRGMARNGMREGLWTSWYEDGAKKWEGRYTAGLREGEWIFWEPDGAVEERGWFRADDRVGPWKRAQDGQ
jgi:antitoxin component YwqK of YwqJK toxin-antitoxin module